MNFWQKLIKFTSENLFLTTTKYNLYWLTEMMIYFLDIDIEVEDYNGQTALYHAAEAGNVEVVKLLIDQGASITARMGCGYSQAIHLAAERGHYEVVRLLLDQGASIEAKGQYDQTALHKAAERGHVEVVRLLIDRGADIEAKDKHYGHGLTALHRAASSSDNQLILKPLFDDQIANIEDKYDTETVNLLFKTVNLLIDRGANIEAKDQRGRTALHYAVSRNDRINILKLLLDRGADIEAKNERGQTALHTVFLRYDTSCDKSRQYHKILQYHRMKLLLDKGANIEAKDEYDKTPIDLAIDLFISSTEYKANATLIKLLASYGPAISKYNKDRLKNYYPKGASDASDSLADILFKSSLEYHTDIKAPKLSREAAINSFEQALALTSNNSNTGSQFLPADTAAHVISYLQDEIIHPDTNNQLANLASEVNNAALFEPDSITNKIKDILKQGAQVSHQKSVTLAAIEQRYR